MKYLAWLLAIVLCGASTNACGAAPLEAPPGCPSLEEAGLAALTARMQSYAEQFRDPMILELASGSYLAVGQADCALTFAEQMVSRYPDSAAAYVTHGLVSNARRQYRSALSDADRAARILSSGGSAFDRGFTGPQADTGLGILQSEIEWIRLSAYTGLRDSAAAERQFAALLALAGTGDPAGNNRATILQQRAHFHVRMRRFDAALADCDEAERALSAASAQYFNCFESRGDAYFGKSEFDQSIVNYDENIRRMEENLRLVTIPGVPQGSVRVLRQQLARAQARSCRAKVRAGLVEAAQRSCANASQTAPDDAYVLLAQSELAAAQHDATASASYRQRAIGIDAGAAAACANDTPCP